MWEEHGPAGVMVAMAGALDRLIGFARVRRGDHVGGERWRLGVRLLADWPGLGSAFGTPRLTDHHYAGRRRPGMVTRGVSVVAPSSTSCDGFIPVAAARTTGCRRILNRSLNRARSCRR